MTLKEKALSRLTPSGEVPRGRYRAPDELLDFLAKL